MGRPRKDPVECSWSGCTKPSRAKGFCDTHYRHLLRRERGIGGIEPKDGTVWKIRVRMPGGGSQPYYFSDPEKAWARAVQARKDGSLLFFARYQFDRDETV